MGEQYAEIDGLIIAAIERRAHPLYDRNVSRVAGKLESLTGREAFRIVDARLQTLRKRGVIQWLTKAEAGGSGGWKVRAGAPDES